MSNIFEKAGPLRPGDVILMFTGMAPTKYLLGTWLQTVAEDAHLACASTPIIAIGLESCIMGTTSMAGSIDEIAGAVANFRRPETIELPSEEADACLQACPFGRANGVVVLVDAERLRYFDLGPTGPTISTVDDTVIRLSEKDDLSLPHVERLCAAICQSAKASGQKWLILCRGYGFGQEIPQSLTGAYGDQRFRFPMRVSLIHGSPSILT